jgi:hypothetical protein
MHWSPTSYKDTYTSLEPHYKVIDIFSAVLFLRNKHVSFCIPFIGVDLTTQRSFNRCFNYPSAVSSTVHSFHHLVHVMPQVGKYSSSLKNIYIYIKMPERKKFDAYWKKNFQNIEIVIYYQIKIKTK